MYELGQLFWYRPVFMTELIVAEMLFSLSLKKRSFFPIRIIAGILVCYGVSFAFPMAFYNAAYFSFMFLCFFTVTVAVMKFSFKESLRNVFYCAIAGYTTQHIAYQIYDLVIVAANINNGMPLGSYGGGELAMDMNPFVTILMLYIYGMVYWLNYVFFASKIRKWDIFGMRKNSMFLLAVFIVLVDIVFGAIITYTTGDNFNRVHMILLYLYNISCCLLALFIQFELPRRKRLEKDLDIVNQLRVAEREQYSISKENIELINLKCHDLRHQIRDIGNQRVISEDVVSEIENVVSIYDSIVKTDNAALNVILTEKSLLCNKYNIVFSCIVDGNKLEFMSESDQYSLFGNMMDNAINAVRDLPYDKRTISLSVKTCGNLLSVNIHNYYQGELKFEHNLPVTTKSDKEYHGFGMKSIKMICEKYGGEMSVTADKNIFNLNIVFPLSEK